MNLRRVTVVTLVLLGALLTAAAWGATYTVTSDADSGAGTLRDAIESANANAGTDTINFGAALAGHSILLLSDLPPLTDPATIINGDINSDGKPDIMLDGQYSAAYYGLNITSNNNVIKGLCISSCGTGIYVNGASAHHNSIISCYLGTNLAGDAPLPNDNYGIQVSNAPFTTIGGTSSTSRNVVASNYSYGVYASRASDLTIRALYCGVNAAGSAALPNNGAGIYASSCRNLKIGAAYSGARNVISGNLSYGLSFNYCTGMKMINTFVGTNAAGATWIPNTSGGLLMSVCTDAVIGGSNALDGNVISGNSGSGIYSSGCYNGPLLRGNKIGVNAAATLALPNSGSGLNIYNSYHAVVGGTTAAARNIISGNDGSGVALDGCTSSTISGNYIGLNGAGNDEVRNQSDGVSLSNCLSTTVGGTTSAHRNLISCDGTGVRVNGSRTSGITITNNYIGFEIDGASRQPCSAGVSVAGSAKNVFVGAAGQGNRILADSTGIYFYRSGAGCKAVANRVGPPAGAALGSTGIDVYLASPRLDTNTIYQQSWYGMQFSGLASKPVVVGNAIRSCGTGMNITNNATPNLGDKTSVTTTDDGGNSFLGNRGYDINNATPFGIKAEANTFASLNPTVVDARFIYDQLDSPDYGRVDFNPLGTVIPTAAPRRLAKMTVAAAPTPQGGAQITVNLSADADLEAQVTNLAGRSIRVLPGRSAAMGLNTLLWDGKSGTGLAVPGGLYLVTVSSRTDGGQQEKQMARVYLQR